MKLLTFILSLTLSQSLFAQRVQSDCNASDSVIGLHKEDATLLTLRRFYEYSHTYKDSALIPENYTDTVLNALIAVYNAEGIPERDSVIYHYNIHPNKDFDMHSFFISADNEVPWMQALSAEVTTSGFELLDDILAEYDFAFDQYYEWSWGYNTASFITPTACNIRAIIAPLAAVPEVIEVAENMSVFDNSDITHTVNSEYVELRYVLKWGDCLAGCTSRRTYVFRVYYDCSVEFAGSFGDVPPPSYSDLESKEINSVSIWPNPSAEMVNVSGITDEFSYRVFDLAGRKLLTGTGKASQPIDLSKFQKGNYLLEIDNGIQRILKTIVKL